MKNLCSSCDIVKFDFNNLSHFKMLTTEELQNMETVDKERLMDFVAKQIGGLGENIVLRRALCFEAEKDIEIYAAVHPSKSIDKEVLTGLCFAKIIYQLLLI